MLSYVLKPHVIKSRAALKNAVIPILSDVSLISLCESFTSFHAKDKFCSEYTNNLSNKQLLFHNIITNYSPKYVDIGPFDNSKIKIGDTTPLFDYVNDYKRIRNLNTEHYVLVPTISKIQEALLHNVTHMSFMTSASNAFQRHILNRSMHEAKAELKSICTTLDKYDNIRKKLYISCISECPIAGKLHIDYILREVCMYNFHYTFDELCLLDTCGTLSFDDYKYLVDALYVFGVPKSKISVKLHMKNMDEVEQIVRYSLKNGFIRFNLSINESDGLTYDAFTRIYEKVFKDYDI
jgi:hypothetical protein